MMNCRKCGIALTSNNQYASRIKYGDYICKNCFKEYNKQFKNYYKQYNKKRYIEGREIFDELKINGCAICGYNKCGGALDFHHTNPKDKKFTVTISRVTRKDFIDELNKCILLCVRCHREIEYCKKVR